MKSNMDEIYHQVPPDYWDKSVNKNLFQSLWYFMRFRAMKKIFARLPDGAGILDVGCGSGFSIEKSIPAGKKFEIYGVDVTEEVIKYAQEQRPSFHFSLAYGEQLPFEEKKFDAVVYLDVIEHLNDPIKSLNEARRVLKDNGFAVILVVKEHHPLFRIIWWFWMKARGKVWEDAHLRVYDEKSLEKDLASAGFKVTEMNKIHLGMSLVAVAYQASSGA